MRRSLLAAVLVAAALAAGGTARAASPVTWDRYSLQLDGKPLFVNAGEVHPQRMPGGEPQWRRVLRTMRAAGLNTVSIYVFWQFHEIEPGRFRLASWRRGGPPSSCGCGARSRPRSG
ncbi:MAG TPA: beta-galactosidase [Thermoleophilaceae bacterium]